MSALFVALSIACLPLRAQLPPEPPGGASPAANPEPRPADAAPIPREQPPEIHYLPDERGRLVPVPGFRYRDFVELLELKEGLPGVPRPPALLVERFEAEVRPRREAPRDACDVTVKVTLRQSRGGWVDVPLGLLGLVLDAPPRHDGPGRFVLDGERSPRPAGLPPGYRAWVDGAADDVHEIALAGTIPLESVADRDAFLLDVPVAVVSRVAVRCDRADPAVTVQPAGLPPRISADGSGSLVVCEGLVGPTRFRIADRRGSEPAAGVLPQASVESLVRVDGRVALYDAVVRVEPAAETGALRIRLPPRATLVRVREPAELVRAEPPAGDDRPASVEVRVPRDASGAATVELECERPVDPSGRTAFDALGFAVDGVPQWRQRGRVAVTVAGEWQVDWDDPAPVRRVDPAPGARQPGFVAAFAWDSEPASVPMRVRPRRSRVVVEPEYRYTVGATRVLLEAKFRVAVRGAPVGRFVVGLDGWSVDEVGPATLVDGAAVTTSGSDVSIPFLQPLAGDAVVEVRAARPIARADERLEWTVPAPRADLVGPATATVTADPDIEVVPDVDRSTGLVRQVVPAGRRPTGDRPQLVYRVDGAEATFGATRRFLPQRVEATIDARVTVGPAETGVEQTIRLDVANVALESIDLAIPADVVSPRSLEVLQGGQALAPFTLPSPEGAAVGEAGDAVRALLAAPLLGAGEIVVRFVVPTPDPAADAKPLRVPFATPRSARVTRQSLQLSVDEGILADVRGDGWRRDAARAGAAPRTWLATRPQAEVELAVTAPRGGSAGETVIEAAWLETRLAGDGREDLFTYAVSTGGPRVVLALPRSLLPGPGPGQRTVETRVDGIPVTAAVAADGTLAVDVPRPAGQSRTSILLQVAVLRPWSGDVDRDGAWYAPGWVGGLAGPVVLEAPRFPVGTLERRFYWELQFAPDEHVVAAPQRWTAQQRWSWGTGGLRREPVVDRAALGDWIEESLRSAARGGETRAAERTRVGVFDERPILAGRALFAGSGSPSDGRVWLVPTWLAVLAVSGPLLALGLTMVYRPRWRRLPAVFALVLPATFAAVAFPAIAPLVVQAAIPGLALSLLAAALRRAAEPASAPPSVGAGSSTRLARAPSLLVNVESDVDGSADVAGRITP